MMNNTPETTSKHKRYEKWKKKNREIPKQYHEDIKEMLQKMNRDKCKELSEKEKIRKERM